ncbi:hemerythrin-like metal-binding protein/PAS domain S-box-containing protein [Oxalobacteraceae bacterium GrIS 2.11]
MQTQFDIFPWNDHFQVGIAVIDEQHQKLVALINRLASGVAFSNQSIQLENVFRELNDYAVYHFKTEQEIWHQYLPGDALEASHQQTHDHFLSFLQKAKSEVAANSEIDSYKKIVAFLTNWLVFHILETDKQMAGICLAVQSGKAVAEAKIQSHDEQQNARQILTAALINMNNDLAQLSFRLSTEIELRLRVEASLTRALNFSKSLINAMQDGFITLDRFGAIAEVNPAFCLMTGFGRKELVGLTRPFPFCVQHADLEKIINRAASDLEAELTMVRKDGKQFPVIVSLFQVSDDNDQLVTWAATIKDITGREDGAV